MKQNTVSHPGGKRTFAVLLALIVLIALGIGISVAYSRLRDLWLEQCVITDVASQVTVSSGRMVSPDAIMEAFGLRNGVNLALVDFSKQRADALKRYPILRSISVTRHLPDRVEISVIERVPSVRLGITAQRTETGRVADAEGMVFNCRRGTSALPVIREKGRPGTQPGKRLEGRARAALELLETARDPEFSELGILEVDISRADYLLATLGNYSRAKIAWTGMDGSLGSAKQALCGQLACLRDAIRARLSTNVKIWNATVPNRIYADTQGVN